MKHALVHGPHPTLTGIPSSYRTYRIMRLFPGMTHPDQAGELPLPFADEVLEYDRIEKEAQAERDEQAARRAR